MPPVEAVVLALKSAVVPGFAAINPPVHPGAGGQECAEEQHGYKRYRFSSWDSNRFHGFAHSCLLYIYPWRARTTLHTEV
jgi:hypothetical protein